MRLQDPQLQNLLAGEYVLGTLRGRARDRFERYLQDHTQLQEAVLFWEAALAPLDELHEPEMPARDLLPDIQRRLGWQDRRPGGAAAGWRLPWLPTLALALVASISIALWAPWQPRFQPDFSLAASVEDGTGEWQFAVDTRNNWIDLRVLSTPQVERDKDLELWLLVDGGAPISLGLLPEDAGRRYRIEAETDLRRGNGLAISVEPAGGSPTGAPTGPVIAAQTFPSA